MLVDFRVANFLSFKEEQVLSMVASSDRSLCENVAEAAGFRLLRSAAVYGPNAAGKSNLIKALEFARSLVRSSDDIDVGGEIPCKPFLLDPVCGDEPSQFGITFVDGGVRYEYDVAVTARRVVRESLTVYPGGSKGRGQDWFFREFDEETGQYNWSFSSYLTGEKSRIRELTRDNVLYLTMAAKLNHEQLTDVYRWINSLGPMAEPESASWSAIAAQLLLPEARNPESPLKRRLAGFLRKADLGISDVRVTKEDVDNEWGSGSVEYVIKGRPYRVLLTHKAEDSGAEMTLDLSQESEGTRQLLRMAIPWFDCLESGRTAFLDEFESSLHPSICAALLKAWHRAKSSEGGGSAQLIFTTHNTLLLESDLLRRDQVWFVEKDSSGASHLYPLTDYSPRKSESLGKGYLSGRYGAIPFVGDLAAVE